MSCLLFLKPSIISIRSPSKKGSAVKKSGKKAKKAKHAFIDRDEELDFDKLAELDQNDDIVHLQDLTVFRVK